MINGTIASVGGGGCLVNGTKYSILNGQTLIDGTGYDIKFGTSLEELPEGSIIYINENGSPAEFYVAKHNYESSLNEAGRTLVVRKDCYDERQWHNSNVNAWASCTMRSWLNSTYKALLAADIQEAMGTTTYRYTPGNGNNTVTTRSDAVFLLSLTELGYLRTYANVEGSTLPIADTLKDVYLNGSAIAQWTRSPCTDTTSKSWRVLDDGYMYTYSSLSYVFSGSRPAFTLPSTTKFNSDTHVIIG